jgi:hypothetical protein
MAVSEIPLSPDNQQFAIRWQAKAISKLLPGVLRSGAWISWTAAAPT